MCGRFTIAISVGFYDRFQVRKELSPPIGSHFNITPDQEIPVICRGNGLYHNLTLMKWGLVPSWTSDPIHGRHPINARKESLLEKPMFKNLVSVKRCLIPASGFFEWKKVGKLKIPYYIHRKDDTLFAFAGLYDLWHRGDERVYSCTIVTTEPNTVVAPLHSRMPAILRSEDETTWLGPGEVDQQSLDQILAPFPPDELEAYRVSYLVNDTSNDTSAVIAPVAEQVSIGELIT